MNTIDLKDRLSDLAEEVVTVDLRDRALHSSRRLAVRRRLAVVAGVVVLGLTGGVAAMAVLPAERTRPPVGDPTTGPPDKIFPGRLVFTRAARTAQTWTWDGGSPRMLGTLKDSEDAEIFRVSPDGRRIAWSNQNGTLGVAALDGSDAREFPLPKLDSCVDPVWSSDSRRLLVKFGGSEAPDEQGTYWLDVQTGRLQGIEYIGGCHYMASADGNHLAWSDGEGGIFVSGADGKQRRKVPVLGDESPTDNPGFTRTYNPLSIAPGGTHIVCRVRSGDEPDGDAALEYNANAVVDTRTGRPVALPVEGTLSNGWFLPDGRLLAQVRNERRTTLVLISQDWKVLDRVDQPSGTPWAFLPG
jgi:TolB protein